VLVLAAAFETLLERLNASGIIRPLLGEERRQGLQELLQQRSEHYHSFPHGLDTTDLSLEEAAWQAQVELGRFRVRGMGASYDAVVEVGGLARIGAALRSRGLGGPVALVSDELVARLYAEPVLDSLHSAGFAASLIQFPAGEAEKTIQTVNRIWMGFVQAGLERGSTVLALGGGVVSDLAGFAAATYLRGIPWAVAPTTLLSMVDASLGGKTGADLPQGKNLVGAFYPPRLVLADPQVLDTLPEAELGNGLAEIVKHGIVGDPLLFEQCAAGRGAALADRDALVRRSMAVKIRIIQADPYEHGRRAELNLGHTAEQLRVAEAGLTHRIVDCLAGLDLPTEIPAKLSRPALLQALQVDKKRRGGVPRFSLPVHIGEVRIEVEVSEPDLKQVLGSS
jgi:shikimate kinase / 3-dehydroquinate synthase